MNLFFEKLCWAVHSVSVTPMCNSGAEKKQSRRRGKNNPTRHVVPGRARGQAAGVRGRGGHVDVDGVGDRKCEERV